jgi:hypothetical protein
MRYANANVRNVMLRGKGWRTDGEGDRALGGKSRKWIVR